MGWIKKTFRDPEIGSAQVEFSTDSLDVIIKLTMSKEDFIAKSTEVSKNLTGMINMMGIKEAKKLAGGEKVFNEAIRQIRDLTADLVTRISEAFSSNMLNDVTTEVRLKENGEAVSYLNGKLIKSQKAPIENAHLFLTAIRNTFLH